MLWPTTEDDIELLIKLSISKKMMMCGMLEINTMKVMFGTKVLEKGGPGRLFGF